MSNMDYMGEIIAFGIDTLILAVCVKQYYRNKYAIQMIQGAPFVDIDGDLLQLIESKADKKLPYVAIRGAVKPLGTPIHSLNNLNVTGVIQKLSIKEHIIQRSTAGFWSENERIVQEVYNAMPFALEDNGYQVEVLDPLAADIIDLEFVSLIDLDVIADKFEPCVPSLMDHIWGFFSGVRQRGLQNTEEMLRTGSLITGIGELTCSMSGRTLRLQPTSNGAPFYLTSIPITSLVRRLDDRKHSFRWLCILFGSLGVIIGSLIFRRYWHDRKRKVEEETIRRELENSRRDRRRLVRDSTVPEVQLCVVCKENPREVILLPCGHVCLCEDCSEGIIENCPICRRQIEKKAAAYIV